MYIFTEQTFTNMYTKINIDISYFNIHTKQSSTTCQIAEKPQSV